MTPRRPFRAFGGRSSIDSAARKARSPSATGSISAGRFRRADLVRNLTGLAGGDASPEAFLGRDAAACPRRTAFSLAATLRAVFFAPSRFLLTAFNGSTHSDREVVVAAIHYYKD